MTEEIKKASEFWEGRIEAYGKAVHCRECRHRNSFAHDRAWNRCDILKRWVNMDDYCAWAERKSE